MQPFNILVMNSESHSVPLTQGKEEMLTSIPFSRPQDSGPSVAIVTKVNRIQDQLVKKHDVELHMHLNRLEIAPQIYGMSVSPSLAQRVCDSQLYRRKVTHICCFS